MCLTFRIWPTDFFVDTRLLGFFLVASVPLQASAEELTRESLSKSELEKLLTGNSLAGNGKVKQPAEPYDWISHYGADGTIRLELKPEWGGLISKGRWWLTDEGWQCRKFETGHGKEGCWRFVREGDYVRFLPVSGVAVEGRAVVLEGDRIGYLQK
ncbi:MAG: hypothetical protein RIC14_01695 [Filomicrobium sp.]